LDFLPMIQYIRCSINPNCLRLLWICGFHVSRRYTRHTQQLRSGKFG